MSLTIPVGNHMEVSGPKDLHLQVMHMFDSAESHHCMPASRRIFRLDMQLKLYKHISHLQQEPEDISVTTLCSTKDGRVATTVLKLEVCSSPEQLVHKLHDNAGAQPQHPSSLSSISDGKPEVAKAALLHSKQHLLIVTDLVK